MKKYFIIAIVLALITSCKKKEGSHKIDIVKLEEQVREVIPESVYIGKSALPQILSLNAEEIQYFDMNQNKIIKVDLKTNKKTLLHIPKGGGYLYFYKQTKNYRAISNGWEINSETKIKVGNEKELIYPQSVINNASNDKIIFSEIKEGIDTENFTYVFNSKNNKLKKLKIKLSQAILIEKERVLGLVRFPEKYEGKLIIYNLLDDNHDVVLTPFKANNFVKYIKSEKVLYYVKNSLVHRLFLDNKITEQVYDREVTSPYVVNNLMLVGYVYDKDEKKYSLTFISL